MRADGWPDRSGAPRGRTWRAPTRRPRARFPRRPAWSPSCQGGLDGGEDQILVDPGHHRHLPDLARQHEMHFALDGFLIGGQTPEQGSGWDAVEAGDRAVLPDGFTDGFAVTGRQMPRRFGEMDRGLHPERDGLAMQKSRVSCLRFKRMSHRVSKVED